MMVKHFKLNLGADAKTDLALLKVKNDIKLKAVSWGNSDEVKVGNWAMAIGNPFGLVIQLQ